LRPPLKAAGKCVPKLITLKSPYRYILHPICRLCARRGAAESETCKVCVLIPELVVRHWWDSILHNRRSDLAER